MNRKIIYSMTCFLASLILTASSQCVEAFKYESKGKRDPFVPLIGSGKDIAAGIESIVSIDDVSLEGIAIGASGKMAAIINGELMKENDKVGSLKIERITKRGVTLSIDNKIYDVKLEEEGGKKSEK